MTMRDDGNNEGLRETSGGRGGCMLCGTKTRTMREICNNNKTGMMTMAMRTRDNDERHVLQSAVYVFDIVNVLIIEILIVSDTFQY